MVCGLPKYAGDLARSRGSSPKLQVLDPGLMSAQLGGRPEDVRADPEDWGRRVESAVGAHLYNGLQQLGGELSYWRERNREVDFIACLDGRITAIEVKSGRRRDALVGMQAFADAFTPDRQLLVGADGIALEDFLSRPVEHWVG
jgi:predicted AAA+ superfamily ATPase